MGNRHKSNLTGIMLGLGISFNQFFPKKKNLFKKKKELIFKIFILVFVDCQTQAEKPL